MLEASEPLLSDREDDDDNNYYSPDPATKGDFIIRIYRVLAVQLVWSICCVVVLFREVGLGVYFGMIPAEYHVLPLVLYIAILIASWKAAEAVRKRPWVHAVMIVLTVVEAVMGMQIAVLTDAEAVVVELCMMEGITTALLVYAEIARDKFATSMALPIAVFSTVIVFAVCIRISAEVSRVEVVRSTQLLCTLIAVLFSFYIVVDVQVLALRERFGLQYSEHVAAVIFLHLDIGNVIWSCIQLAVASLPFKT